MESREKKIVVFFSSFTCWSHFPCFSLQCIASDFVIHFVFVRISDYLIILITFFLRIFFSFFSILLQISIRIQWIADFIASFVDEIMYERSMFCATYDMNVSMFLHGFNAPIVQNIIDKAMRSCITFAKSTGR